MPCARKYKILGIKKSCSPSFDLFWFGIETFVFGPTQHTIYSWYLDRLLHWILLSLNRPSLSKPKNSSYMLFHTNIDKILNKTNKKVNTIFITQPILTCSFICWQKHDQHKYKSLPTNKYILIWYIHRHWWWKITTGALSLSRFRSSSSAFRVLTAKFRVLSSIQT